MLPGNPREHFSWRDVLFPRGGSRGCRGEINACVSDSDRRFCHQRIVRAWRHRIYPHLRRLRRAQPVPWRDHGAGGGGRMGGGERAASRHLFGRAGRRRGGAGFRADHLFRGGATNPAIPAHPQRREGNLRPHGHAALGHHDPGIDRLLLHQQRQDRAADRRGGRRYLRRAAAAQRDLHRLCLLPCDRAALAPGESYPHRQGRTRRFDESARRDAARARTRQHLCRGLGDLRHPGRHCRRVARHVLRGQFLQRRAVDSERVLDRGAGRPRQRIGFADCSVRRRLSRNPHRLSRLTGLPDHPRPSAAGRRDVCAAAGPAWEAMRNMGGFFKSRLFFISLAIVIIASTLPLYVSGYVLGLLTVAYYFGVFAMSWDLLFGFAGEVNFGPTFLIGVGAYTAGILNNQYGWSVYLCIVLGALASVVAGVVLALPALRVRGPYFGLTTLVAVLMLQNFVVVFADLTGGEIGLTIPDVITINASANYWIALGFMTISALILYGLSQSPIGLVLQASGQDPVQAGALGFNIVKHKLAAFIVSAFFSGLSGALLVFYFGTASVGTVVDVAVGVNVIVAAVLGGRRTVLGAALGAIFLIVAGEFLRPTGELATFIVSTVALLVVLFFPGGFLGAALSHEGRS